MRKAASEPKKILVYQFGGTPTAGFCADYWSFLNCLIRCLQLGIGFRFGKVIRPSGIVTQKGWADYFEPFCEEVKAPLLDWLNVWQFPFARKFPITKFIARIWLRNLSRPRADYFMFDRPWEIQSLGPPIFDENQNWLLAQQDLMRILWTYNSETEEEVRPIVNGLNLPNDYLAICVRCGDKLQEAPYVEIERYAKEINALDGENRTLFIVADDYRIIPKVAEVLKGYALFSLTEDKSIGYYHSQFRNLPPNERRRRMIRFLAQMEIMRDAKYFIGSMTTSISWVVSAFRGGERVIYIDNNK